MNNIIVGLDLGTSFVRAVIAEDVGEGRIEIIGTAQRRHKSVYRRSGAKGWL